jgi:YhcH/YjgK/YiaL family protein
MITDHLANAHRYTAIGPRFARAFEFLQHTDLGALDDGRYELEGGDLYALVQRYTSKRPAEGRWEAHRRFADLQLVVDGQERMGYGPIDRFSPGEYEEAKDVEFLAGDGDFVLLRPAEFVVLWPGEVHMPGMAVGEPAAVKKIVVKIRVD